MSALISAFNQLTECLGKPVTVNNLRKIVLLTTRFHWGKKENHGELAEEIGCNVFDFENPEKGLQVELAAKWDPERYSNGIYVGLAAAPFEKKGLGDLAHITENGATTVFSWICRCRIAISHVFDNEDMSYLAAESTQTFFAANKQAIADRQGLMAVNMLGMTEAKRLGKNPDPSSSVDVILEMPFTWSAETTPESHLLKQVVSEIQSHTSPT